MLTSVHIKNFKRLGEVKVDLGEVTLLIGPNNSGKTSALQALALWDIGRRRWTEKRDHNPASERSGVTINRRDLTAIPVPSAKLLWRSLRVNDTKRNAKGSETARVYIEIRVEGDYKGTPWACAFEYYYANEESFYCRLSEGDVDDRVPEGARQHSIVFLPPMSGLADRETRKERGELNTLIGEGQTAQVLRNLCWILFTQPDRSGWEDLLSRMESLFQIRLNEPKYVSERSELTLSFRDMNNNVDLDVSSAGRGCQQVLLLLAFLLGNQNAVLLLDEPDAHLEILRQRDIYTLVSEIAKHSNSQVVAASHSEVILQEAAEQDVVVAFLGKPHRIDNNSQRSQLQKALAKVRFADYFVAEQRGWVLYLEGSTDLAVLRVLAARLNHPAKASLAGSVPAFYLGSNHPPEARDHFYALREAKPNLPGLALFDRIDRNLTGGALVETMWQRREIENYIATRSSIEAFVTAELDRSDLIDGAEIERRQLLVQACMNEIGSALTTLGKPDPWGPDCKVTDDFLDPLFKLFYEKLGAPQRTYKRDYHGLAQFVDLDEGFIGEVREKLDAIYEVAVAAQPTQT